VAAVPPPTSAATTSGTEIPIASGIVNPATGRVWLPSELKAAQDAEQVKQSTLATQTPAALPLATSSTAPAPSSVTYSGALAPKKIKSDFTQTTTGYKLPSTPTVPTVPNMTQAPAKTSAPTASVTEPNQLPPKKTKTGGRVAGAPPSQTANAIRQRAARAAKNTAAEPSAMSNMSRQLAARGQAQTSTGGATIATGTGVRHAASPFNPNQTAGQKSQAAEKIAVDDITNQVDRRLKMVKTADDLKKLKDLIDRQFSKHGLVSESAFAKRDYLIQRARKILENRSNRIHLRTDVAIG